MMGWTSKDLRKDLKVLKEMYSKETDADKKEELLTAIHTVIYNICDVEMGEEHNNNNINKKEARRPLNLFCIS